VTRQYIPKNIRIKVAEQAKYRCGYCLTQEEIVGMAMEFDHLVPSSQKGANREENLWLACSTCNDTKNDRTTALDPLTGNEVSLFNPRTQVWKEHFSWSIDSERIVGLTPIGRATVFALNLNRVHLVKSRRVWVRAGWHPPED
jgi:hypothetical protein